MERRGGRQECEGRKRLDGRLEGRRDRPWKVRGDREPPSQGRGRRPRPPQETRRLLQGTGPCGEGHGACEGGLGPSAPRSGRARGDGGAHSQAAAASAPAAPALCGVLARTAWVNPHKGATSPQCEDSCVNSAQHPTGGGRVCPTHKAPTRNGCRREGL